MRPLAVAVLASVVLVGCRHNRVVRDAEVYRAELAQYDQWASRQAALLRGFVETECACEGDRFTTQRCAEAAGWLLTVEARHDWHRHMALFNAGLVGERPPETVVVVQIPARPFLRPAFKQFEKGAQKRFLGRVAGLMGMAAGPTPDKGGS